MNIVRKFNGWRSLAGMLGVGALALGLSLKLEGAPPFPQPGQSNNRPAPVVAPATTATGAQTVSAVPSHAAVSSPDANRATAGKVPSTGLRVLSTSVVDYRDDEGTRRRQAGTLVGPVPWPGQQSGIASGCATDRCSFDIECDDSNKCTVDRCDIILGTPLCSGWCVHDSVANDAAGGCDNGVFCDGKETCQGAVCTIAANNDDCTGPGAPLPCCSGLDAGTCGANLVGQACDNNASCGETGNCNTSTHLCEGGNIGEPCNKHADCNVAGRCIGAPNAGDACDSNADCAPGTCTTEGRCQGGACENGTAAICCSDPEHPTVCAEAVPKCSLGSLNKGVACQKDSDCKNGLCERCQNSCVDDDDCYDPRRCNGLETCLRTCVGGTEDGQACPPSTCPDGGTCLGQCQPGRNPCGSGARCSERQCKDPGTGLLVPFVECLYDSDCPENPNPPHVARTCVDITVNNGIKCYEGRCCTPGANPAAELTCAIMTLKDCDTAGGRFYSMDGGQHLLTDLCGGDDSPPAVNPTITYGCPKYTSGITQLKAGQCVGGANNGLPCNDDAGCPGGRCNQTPVYPVVIGPISDSTLSVPAPGGPGIPFHAIGDDYAFFNSAVCNGGSNNGNACTLDSQCPGGRCGSYMAMVAMRYVGYSISGGARLSIDFYDADGKFIEDVVTAGMAEELGLNLVIFSPPLTISPSGWMNVHVASDFAPDMRFAMGSTTAAAGAGVNNPNRIWINGSDISLPPTSDNNFLKMCAGGPNANQACVGDPDCPDSTCVDAPAMLAFELVGDKVADPIGGCCEAGGPCVDGVVSWVCFAQGNTYLGDNKLCARCNGAPNTGGACRTCISGAHSGEPCQSDAFCGGADLCAPDTARCRTCVGGTSPSGTPCTSVANCTGAGASCPPLLNSCSTGNVGVSCNACTNKACTRVCSTKTCTGNRVCTNKTCNGARVCTTKQCSGAPADTACTGSGQGTCPSGQTCNFIGCAADATCTPTGGTCPVLVTTCTGTGQGTCATSNQTCDFIACTSDTPCTPNGGTCPAVVSPCTGTGQGTCATSNQTCSFITCTNNTPCTPVGGGTCQNAASCTGTGQGSCAGTNQTCNYVSCSTDTNCTTPPTGAGGTCQPNNDFCDLAGVCNLETLNCALGACAGGSREGQSCSTNTDCPSSSCVIHTCTDNTQCSVEGTCVPVACTSASVCRKGACCNADPLECNAANSAACCTLEADEAACESGHPLRTFMGFGTECDADSSYEEAQQHCCPIPQYADTKCMGGPHNLQSCDDDTDCRFCVGGSHNGEDCTFTSDPGAGGCLDEGVCTTGHCVGGLLPTCSGAPLKCVGGPHNGDTCVNATTCTACLTDAECPDNSGQCRGRCVNRGTGGDSCEDAYVHVITVPELSDGPKTITISGNNLPATDTADESDTCHFGTDPGWWEAFSIDKCARVRLDLCCSDPVKQPTWNNFVTGCPDQCLVIGGAPDPYTVGQVQGRRGIPYCDEDNFWGTFGPLEAGTYWFPLYSELAGTHGDYQLHFTVQACVTAACCYNTCSGGANVGLHCDKGITCPGGTCVGGGNNGAACTEHAACLSGVCSVTCVSNCLEMEKDQCDELLGFFLAPPNIVPAQPLCVGGSPGPCEEGSCCTGPGVCLDQVSETDPTPMNSAICDENAFNGVFFGGIRCKGGHCQGGSDDGESCDTTTENQCVGGSCVADSDTQMQQKSPCPVCTVDGAGNCQRFENDDQFSPSDLNAGSGEVWADDFTLTSGGVLNTVCVSGVYIVPGEVAFTADRDCSGVELPIESQRPDNFRVRIYEDDGGKPGGGNCTNGAHQRCFVNSECDEGGTCLLKPLGESFTSRTKLVVPGAATVADLIKMWTFQLTLTNPIGTPTNGGGPLVAGKCYWLEVANKTTQEVPGCTWHWSQLLNTSTQGNQFSAAGSNTNGYGEGSQRAWDMVWCLNLSIAPGGCASHDRACCSCVGGCTLTSLDACDDASTDWHENATSCPPTEGCSPPPNDSCVLAEEVPVGLYSVSSQCATTDGGNPVPIPFTTPTDVNRDIWFFFRPTVTCPLRVDTCSSSQDQYFDSTVTIYHDDQNPTQCVCPLNQGDSDAWYKISSDDGCVGSGRAAGGIATLAAPGAIAGNCYTIRIAGFPGNDEGGRTAADISCGPAACGDGRRNGTEECDPGNPNAIPPLPQDNDNCRTATPSTLCDATCHCTVPNPCGNGVLNAGEECDPGGVPCGANSTCRVGGDPKQCTCTAYCSNNRVEEGEECDGTGCDANSVTPDGACTTDADCRDATHQRGRCRDAACLGRCRNTEDPEVCLCPAQACGNGRLEELAGEECEFGKCTGGAQSPCETNDECAALSQGTCDLTVDRGDCPNGQCRTKNDPLHGCLCGCADTLPPNTPVWGPATSGPTPCVGGGGGVWPNCNPEATTRSLRFTVVGDEGPSKPEAIKVTMIDLQHPIPANLPANPPQNFSGYESATCAPFKCVGGSRNGLTCISVADCPKVCVSGSNAGTLCPNGNECTGGGTCPATTCTAAVEANGCARWVGKPGTFLESQDGGPASGTYRAARLQCTPFYWDWKPEGLIAVVGAEIAPSSEYSVQVYGASCTGVEANCTAVSPAVTMFTRRAGDTGPNFNPPATTSQPDAVDVVVLVNKFKGLAGAPVKAIAQIQPNLTELNADLSALDITAAVDGVKGVAYSFSGPCACPSTVTCGLTACANATVCVNTYGVGSTCVKTCVGGSNAGDPCINTTDPHNHCPGGGVCGAGGATPGFCRDRCGRCTPP